MSHERLKHLNGQGHFDLKLNAENIVACFSDLKTLFELNHQLRIQRADKYFDLMFLDLLYNLGQRTQNHESLARLKAIKDSNKTNFEEKVMFDNFIKAKLSLRNSLSNDFIKK